MILLLLLILCGCKENHQSKELCKLKDTPMGNFIVFKNFGKFDFNKLILHDISSGKEFVIHNPSLQDNGNGELRLQLNPNDIPFLQEEYIVLINDSMKYKISDIKTEHIQRTTMWYKKMFCELKTYRLNDSLINNSYVVIYR